MRLSVANWQHVAKRKGPKVRGFRPRRARLGRPIDQFGNLGYGHGRRCLLLPASSRSGRILELVLREDGSAAQAIREAVHRVTLWKIPQGSDEAGEGACHPAARLEQRAHFDRGLGADPTGNPQTIDPAMRKTSTAGPGQESPSVDSGAKATVGCTSTEMASIDSSNRDDPPPAASPPKGSVVNLTARRAERALARIAARREGIASIRPGVGAETIRVIVREELGSLRRELSELATTNDNVLTLDGAAELLGVCSKTVLAWRRDQGLPAHRAGSTWRFLRSELLAWVRAQRGRDVR